MENNLKNLWWGYYHISGTIQAKRYSEILDIQEAQSSPFCKWVTPEPFEANNRTEALETVEKLYNAQGLIPDKYIITKQDGTRVNTDKYFVLSLENDIHAQHALISYANSVRQDNRKLADNLDAKLSKEYGWDFLSEEERLPVNPAKKALEIIEGLNLDMEKPYEVDIAYHASKVLIDNTEKNVIDTLLSINEFLPPDIAFQSEFFTKRYWNKVRDEIDFYFSKLIKNPT